MCERGVLIMRIAKIHISNMAWNLQLYLLHSAPGIFEDLKNLCTSLKAVHHVRCHKQHIPNFFQILRFFGINDWRLRYTQLNILLEFVMATIHFPFQNLKIFCNGPVRQIYSVCSSQSALKCNLSCQ